MGQFQNYVVPKYIYIMWLTLVVSLALAIVNQEWLTVFISLATLGISVYAVWLSQRITFHIPAALLSAAIVFIYATLFLGEVHSFYDRFWWWDVMLHTGSAVGFGLIGAIILILLFRQGKVAASPFLVSVFAFAFALAIGALWEIFEFAMDQLFGFNMQRSGLIDTMADLIVDSIGALLAAVASFAYLSDWKSFSLTKILSEAIERN